MKHIKYLLLGIIPLALVLQSFLQPSNNAITEEITLNLEQCLGYLAPSCRPPTIRGLQNVKVLYPVGEVIDNPTSMLSYTSGTYKKVSFIQGKSQNDIYLYRGPDDQLRTYFVTGPSVELRSNLASLNLSLGATSDAIISKANLLYNFGFFGDALLTLWPFETNIKPLGDDFRDSPEFKFILGKTLYATGDSSCYTRQLLTDVFLHSDTHPEIRQQAYDLHLNTTCANRTEEL